MKWLSVIRFPNKGRSECWNKITSKSEIKVSQDPFVLDVGLLVFCWTWIWIFFFLRRKIKKSFCFFNLRENVGRLQMCSVQSKSLFSKLTAHKFWKTKMKLEKKEQKSFYSPSLYKNICRWILMSISILQCFSHSRLFRSLRLWVRVPLPEVAAKPCRYYYDMFIQTVFLICNT